MSSTRSHAPSSYAAFHQRSITQRDAFWAEQAGLIDWQTAPRQIGRAHV